MGWQWTVGRWPRRGTGASFNGQRSTANGQPIGLVRATALVVAIIIGASIFVQPSEITRLAPTVGGMLAVWLVCGVLTLFGALICARLASAFPRTGGVYIYLSEAWSP